MKRRAVSMIAILVMSIIGFTACNNGASDEGGASTDAKTTASVQYTCPMHPEVISDKRGDCPKCGMALVEKTDAQKSGSDTSGMEQHDSTHGH
jgi:hypothetical protein